MKKMLLAVLAVLPSLFSIACEGPTAPTLSLPSPVTVVHAAPVEVSIVKKTPTATATSSPTSTATATATVAATATPVPTRNPLATPTSSASNDPDVLKLIDAMPCVVHANESNAVNFVFIVDGGNTGLTLSASIVFGNLNGDAMERAPLGSYTSGVYPKTSAWSGPRPFFMWVEGTAGSSTYITDRCAISAQ